MRPVLATVPALLALLALSPPALGRTAATPDDWQHDLDLLIEELEAIHPDPWFHARRADVVGAVEALRPRLPGMSWEESFVELHRIVAALRDGHTRVQWHRNADLDLRRVQVHYRKFPDGLYVIAAHPDVAELVGGRVLSIGSATVEEAWAGMEPLVPADNDWTALDRTPRFLTYAELLVGLGILDSRDACPIEVEKNGKVVRAVAPSAVDHPDEEWPNVLDGVELPLYLRHPERAYFFEHLPEHDAVYLNFRRVRDDEDESFADFCDRAFDYLDEHEVGRLVVDLRLNGGGNNYLNKPLIHGIIRNERVNREGRLWVIVGRTTFSAAMCGTIDLERQTEALFAGEPTGATPNHHGDAVPITLPRTGVTVSISALFWQNSDPRDVRPFLDPDLPVAVEWDDYVHGRDPVLAACLAHDGTKRKSIGRAMDEWLREDDDVDLAIARYRELRASDDAAAWNFGEYELNAVGYDLLGKDRFDDALAVFELNVEMYPRAFNPWDSLGEALAGAGRTEEAIEAYERSVELNPASRSGQSALRRLRRQLQNDAG